MYLNQSDINKHNLQYIDQHTVGLGMLNWKWGAKKCEEVIELLQNFQVAIPSWALGAGGTRFGRFGIGGEPASLEDKISDVGLLHQLNKASGVISLHIPWDIPDDPDAIKKLAASYQIKFDAVNSNTFQDQKDQAYSYRFGSLQHTDKRVRQQAIQHNKDVIQYGEALGSQSLTVWLADGSSFPGQLNFRTAFQNTLESMHEIYAILPAKWKMFVEYKAFEPNFYSMTVGDWGQSLLYAQKLGNNAYTLVDLGHHLPNANIEQIVSLLLMEGKLGGFHFNDSKYGDDDLTVGCINPYQLFLIFTQLIEGLNAKRMNHAKDLGWMIDASHNIKDPLEDLLQSVEAIMIAYAQALLVDQDELKKAQLNNDVVTCQEILQNAYRTDVRYLVAEARVKNGGVLLPLQFYRSHSIRQKLTERRGYFTKATGL